MTKRHSLILLAFPLLLAGCTDTDWDHALSYSGLEEKAAPADVPQRRAAPNPQPAAAAAEPTARAQASDADFCRSVAAQDASADGFDPATQRRIFAQSYAQCAAIYTR